MLHFKIQKNHLSEGINKINGSTFIFILFFSLLFGKGWAQPSFSRWDSIPVKISGSDLKNPWAGGINFPQFSSIDLDGNGVNDLFVFDRSVNKILTFINQNISDSSSYIDKPQYQKLFPKTSGWILLADYNKDGKQDIFTSNPKGGVTVYCNQFSTSDGLKFVLVDSLLKTNFGANKFEIYVSPWDIPAIADIDDDGDIDILAFNSGGITVTYYKNISMENFGIPDSLVFEIDDVCWGKFEEEFANCNIALGVSCKGNFNQHENTISEAKHAGSTLLALDLDGDFDKELLVGDLICSSITQLTNGGDLSVANMIELNTLYPVNFSVKIKQFPAAFFLDVNNDGKKDLLVSPSAINISENFESVWFYKNTGTNSIPQFEFQSKSFLQNEMIDVGEGANVALFDADGDSLQDLLIGNYGYFQSGASYLSELSFYKNIGTKTNPSFELVTRDYANISSLGLLAIHPCFGDIDGDGDADMLIGESQGKLFLFNNTSTTAIAYFSLTSGEYKNIDVGQFSAPQLVDVNRDGKLDLLIGERNGNINYYENTGTINNAEFTLVTDSFGKVDVRKPAAVTGYSVPLLIELDTLPKYSLFVGTESGTIYLYENIDENLNGTFLLADTFFQDIAEGIRATISTTDLNDDGNPDLITGNYRGGVAIYKNNADPRIKTQKGEIFSLQVFPNPAAELLTVTIPELKNSAEIILFTTFGAMVYYRKAITHGKYFIQTNKIAAGIYYLRIIIDDNIQLQKKIAFVK